MHMRAGLVLLGLLHLAAPLESFADESPKSNDQRVREYVTAFNEREIDAMLGMVSDDIQWLSVTGAEITLETQGKPALRESLEAYFKSTPSVKSELQWVQATASRVAALERAVWESNSSPKSQASLCVFELRDGLIVRVYYYPVEK